MLVQVSSSMYLDCQDTCTFSVSAKEASVIAKGVQTHLLVSCFVSICINLSYPIVLGSIAAPQIHMLRFEPLGLQNGTDLEIGS